MKYGWNSAEYPSSQKYLVEEVLRILSAHKVKTVLDIGCGNGYLCHRLAECGCRVVGIDGAEDAIEVARRAYPELEFFVVDVREGVPAAIQGRQFDAVVSMEVVEHIDDPGAVPGLANAVLPVGGVFIVTTPYHGYLKNLLLSLAGRWDQHHNPLRVGGHLKFWSRRTLGLLFERDGFRPECFRGVGRWPLVWKSMIMIGTKQCESDTAKAGGGFGRLLRRAALRLAIVALALLFGVLLSEGLCRVFLEPVDYLVPMVVDDPLLGHAIAPHSGGHDEWGFRNRSVPIQSDIVAIGDSQTYGSSALARSSWPAVVSRRLGRTVYNCALGGYGPVEYERLLVHRALSLKPKCVVVGLYMGNDLWDAAGAVATPCRKSMDGITVFRPVPLRKWLDAHSVFCRLLATTIGNSLRKARTSRYLPADDHQMVFRDAQGEVITGFDIRKRLTALDRDSKRVTAGLEATKASLARMSAIASTKNIAIVVLILPTKEAVYEDGVRSVSAVVPPLLQDLWSHEASARVALMSFFRSNSIAYLDVLPVLRKASMESHPYPTDFDGHPNAYGYAAIGEAVAARLQTNAALGTIQSCP